MRLVHFVTRKLHDHDREGDHVYINPELVVAVRANEDITAVWAPDGSCTYVEGTLVEVAHKLQNV